LLKQEVKPDNQWLVKSLSNRRTSRIADQDGMEDFLKAFRKTARKGHTMAQLIPDRHIHNKSNLTGIDKWVTLEFVQLCKQIHQMGSTADFSALPDFLSHYGLNVLFARNSGYRFLLNDLVLQYTHKGIDQDKQQLPVALCDQIIHFNEILESYLALIQLVLPSVRVEFEDKQTGELIEVEPNNSIVSNENCDGLLNQMDIESIRDINANLALVVDKIERIRNLFQIEEKLEVTVYEQSDSFEFLATGKFCI